MQTTKAAIAPEKLAEQISELLMNGGTLGSVYDYTDGDYEVLYALGHSLYAQGRYTDAVKAFGYLVMHNHLERRFVNALASSLQMVKNYEEALNYYSMTSVMDMTDPKPTFHSAECLIALRRVDEALQALDIVIGQCTLPQHEALKARAETMRTLITSKGSTSHE